MSPGLFASIRTWASGIGVAATLAACCSDSRGRCCSAPCSVNPCSRLVEASAGPKPAPEQAKIIQSQGKLIIANPDSTLKTPPPKLTGLAFNNGSDLPVTSAKIYFAWTEVYPADQPGGAKAGEYMAAHWPADQSDDSLWAAPGAYPNESLADAGAPIAKFTSKTFMGWTHENTAMAGVFVTLHDDAGGGTDYALFKWLPFDFLSGAINTGPANQEAGAVGIIVVDILKVDAKYYMKLSGFSGTAMVAIKPLIPTQAHKP